METGSNGTPADGALVKDSNDACIPPAIYGIYDTGKVLTDSNFVLLNVTVTKPGFYKIYTDEQNGFSFADSGFFSVIGTKTVKLKATGTPILPITTDFVVNFDSTICGFSITVTKDAGSNNSNPNESDSAWVFSDGTRTFAGTVSSAYFFDADTTGTSGHFFEFAGYIPGSSDTAFRVVIEVPTSNAIPAGTYSSTTSALFDFYRADASNPNGFTSIYWANPTVTPEAMQFNVISYNSTTGILEATMSGTARNESGGTTTISSGKFTVKVD
ncbi:hypothetical protein FLA_5040 [Filimonas lacunae]|nr:hypothetical protein FLA_5040 [Filimonas lacunae]